MLTGEYPSFLLCNPSSTPRGFLISGKLNGVQTLGVHEWHGAIRGERKPRWSPPFREVVEKADGEMTRTLEITHVFVCFSSFRLGLQSSFENEQRRTDMDSGTRY